MIEASHRTPVLVDFHADWCPPCRVLAPFLETMANRKKGRVRVAHVAVDDNEGLAGLLGLHTLPTVIAFLNGQEVDRFVGLQPVDTVVAFVRGLVARCCPGGLYSELARAETALVAGDAAGALALFEGVWRREPGSLPALAGIFRARITQGEVEAVRGALALLDEDDRWAEPFRRVHAFLEILAGAGSEETLSGALDRLHRDPADREARRDAACGLFARGDAAGAVDLLIEPFGADPAWSASAEQTLLLKVADVLGPANPVIREAWQRFPRRLFS
ncbi:tetratricopeptide repeat protein [Phaeovibrio sulfidiphilus]|uniref:Tetratricopeptide repeat protein n=1 Tax=Phaeovibrio sulfidiphilus TaxID=1220600 RepID=A0A8J7CWA7_9PROT|nr:tetratricopeptide repeat protein [Phaeovibrio sulfidiphilus]